MFQTLKVDERPRARRLAGRGVQAQPLIRLLRSSRDDERGLHALLDEGGEGGAAGGPMIVQAGTSSGRSGSTMKYSMDSMGCQMNSADAERMEGQLRSLGFVKTEEPTDAQAVHPQRPTPTPNDSKRSGRGRSSPSIMTP